MVDLTFLLFIQQIRQSLGSVFDTFFLEITSLAESLPTFMLLAAVYWCINKSAGQFMSLNVSIACTYSQFFKWLFRIERPWVRNPNITPVEKALSNAGGYSFPSGHTARAGATWGALGFWSYKEKKNKAAAGIVWCILGLIVFSRNYLGVHTPQDVIAALVFGIILWFIIAKTMEWADGGKNRDIIVSVIGCLLCFLPMLKAGCLSNAGAGMGFFIGWAVERHWVRFNTDGSITEKLVRFAVGAVFLVLNITVLPSVLGLGMASKYAGFFATFLTALYIIVIYPFFFSRKICYKWGIILGITVYAIAGIYSFAATASRHEAEWKAETQIQADEAQTILPEQEAAEVTPQESAADTVDAQQIADIKIIAHRGYSGVYPENTISAFRGAIDIGADMTELDVQQTKDGIIVVFHDDDLTRTAGIDGTIADFTYDELLDMEVGSWFSEEFTGEKIPTLAEALEVIRESDLEVYLELKDIGEKEGFVEGVLAAAEETGMQERCIFASFQYNYLTFFKEQGLRTLYNVSEYDETLPLQKEADYYGLNSQKVTPEAVKAIHDAGKKAFVWTVDDPKEVRNQMSMGIDGIVTNQPGIAKVAVKPEYGFLTDYYIQSFAMPGLYGKDLPPVCEDVIVQGFAKVKDRLVVTAYSKSGNNDSVLFVLNSDGKLDKIVSLGFKAHTGGTAYDEVHDLLWITGKEGEVYALSWQKIESENTAGEIIHSFQAGLVNHNDSKVASFLDVFDGKLYVGSYVDGKEGYLNCYDITNPAEPVLISEQSIPERIQGITFEKGQDKTWVMFSQGYQTEDSRLLVFEYSTESQGYIEPEAAFVLPEGAEQIEATQDGLYLLFESAARPYRPTARIVNDQIYVLRKEFLSK